MADPTQTSPYAPPPPAEPPKSHFFGHPRQLGTLFYVELWERFSFYGMQAILLIYLYYAVDKGGLAINENTAGGIVSAYNGSIYLASILSGWLADRVLGAEKTLFLSGVVVMLGHLVLALLPGTTGLVLGLMLIALGSGGVKSSAGTMVGSLYEGDDSLRLLRDAGFSIFYTAVNVGGFVGPLIVGVLQVHLGFHYAFGAAAVGMAFGLWRYWHGRRLLPPTPPVNPLNARQGLKIALGVLVSLALLGGVVYAGLLRLDNFSQVLLAVVGLTCLLYFAILFSSPRVSATEKRHMTAYVPLFAVMCLFWAVWSQVFTVVTMYFDKNMDRTVAGFEIPVAWLSALQSLWVILFAGMMAALWTRLGVRQPKTPMKFAMSMMVLGASYLCFIPFLSTGTVMPLAVLAVLMLSITISELLLSPISLSFATKIAPEAFKTQMMSFNFLTLALGFALGGVMTDDFYVPEKAVEFYTALGALGIGGGVLLFLLLPWLNRMLRDVD